MDALDRMFTSLIRTLRNRHPELLGNPFEVAELYQTIIPYRHHRRELGLESNQDYELTLMALLSGARGYLVGEGRMQETLRAALASPNPDTTLFRSFATSRVAVATDALRRLDQSGESGAEEPAPLGSESTRSASSPRLAEHEPTDDRSSRAAKDRNELPPAYSHPLGKRLYGGAGAARESRGEPERATSLESFRAAKSEARGEPPAEPARDVAEPRRESRRNDGRESVGDPAREKVRERSRETVREPAREPVREPHSRAAGTPAQAALPTPSPSPSPTPSPASGHAHLAMTSTSRSTTASALGGSCRYCGGTLPEGRRIVFCPHCGQNLTIQHCPACSTELELGWKYCTTCGRSIASA